MGASRELAELASVVTVSSGNVGVGVSPAGTGLLELKAGTSSVAPLEFNAGTNTTTAVAGTIEYDGRVVYATPQGTQRGVIPGAQFFRLDSGFAGANVNTAQSVFGVGVTLSGSTVYAFDYCLVLTKSAGTTSHTLGLGYGGTATTNNFLSNGSGFGSNAVLPTSSINVNSYFFASNSTANQTVSGPTTSAIITWFYRVAGTVSINAGGTFIPQYTLSAAPGGAYTTQAGSYFLIYPIGASGANVNVGTWA